MAKQGLIQIIIQWTVDTLVMIATDLLLPAMAIAFTIGVFLRTLIYFTVKREEWFAKQFEKRVHEFLTERESRDISFYVTMKLLLEKTFYELFEVRSIMKRRNPDIIMSMTDRIFLIQHGCAILVKDTLSQIKHLKHNSFPPKLLEISKFVFQRNPCFSKVFGVIPASLFNDILNILPGLFIVGGIFGTFLGIMKALPELGGMDLNDIEGTKAIMDEFLLKISFSMSTSIIGIVVSVSMTVVNTILSPEKLFMEIVERYENALDVIWNRSNSNDFDKSMDDFDENKDPMTALAQNALRKELKQEKKFINKKDLRLTSIDTTENTPGSSKRKEVPEYKKPTSFSSSDISKPDSLPPSTPKLPTMPGDDDDDKEAS